MDCPNCHSNNTYKRKRPTELGYNCYQCKACGKRYYERTNTPFNFIEYPTDVALLVIFHSIRYRLSYENVAEIFWLRGLRISAETVRLWVLRFGVLLGKSLRKSRKGKTGKSWHVDETCIKVHGEWCYLYRARDKQGELIDCYLSPTRDKSSAMLFFNRALGVVGHKPTTITTDKNLAYLGAIKEVFGGNVKHRNNKYLNNIVEQDHSDFKSVYKAMHVFKDFLCAFIYCTIFEELRNFLRATRNKSCHKKLNSTEKHRIILSKFHKIAKVAIAG